jgi:hypothetical protein
MSKAKKQKSIQKINLSKTGFNDDEEKDHDWAADHNYDVDPPENPQQGSVTVKFRYDPHTKCNVASKIGDFRTQTQLSSTGATVPGDMSPPYVAFIKHFGKNITDVMMRNFFSMCTIKNMFFQNSDKAMWCLIEVDSRDELSKALLVSGKKMMWEHPCVVDIASSEQVDKLWSSSRHMTSGITRNGSTAAPAIAGFNRDDIGTAEQLNCSQSRDKSGSRLAINEMGVGRGIFGSATADQQPMPKSDSGDRNKEFEGRGGFASSGGFAAMKGRNDFFGTSSAGGAGRSFSKGADK